jgi:hypothetical protein
MSFGLGRNFCEKKPALCEKHTSQCEKKTNYVFLKHRVRLSASCDQKFLCVKKILSCMIKQLSPNLYRKSLLLLALRRSESSQGYLSIGLEELHYLESL